MHEYVKNIFKKRKKKKKDLKQAEKSLTKKQEHIWIMDISYCIIFDIF